MAKSLPVSSKKQKVKRTPLERAQQQFNELVKEIAAQEQRNRQESVHADQYHQLYQQKVLPLLRQYAAERLLLVRQLDALFYNNRFSKSQSRTYLTWTIETLHAVAAYDDAVAELLAQKQEELIQLLPKRGGGKKNREELAASDHETSADPDDFEWDEADYDHTHAHGGNNRPHPEAHMPDIDDIGPLYKELAKKIHPDLEQDEQEKERKHALMQQLTEARKNRDLYTLLRIRGELASVDQADSWSLHQLKRFNKLLQDKLQQLQQAQVHTLAGRMLMQGWDAFGGKDPEQDINREVRSLKKTIRAIRDERAQISTKEHLDYLIQMMEQASY